MPISISSTNMMVKLKKNIALSESGFLFNPATGDSFSVNITGQKIIEMLKSGMEHNEIVSTLVDDFDADARLIREDLDDFINHLKQLKMVEDETQ